MATGHSPWRAVGIVLALLAATLVVYWPALGFEFLSYDDPDYVTNNPQVIGGLTPENVAWAFTEFHAANWHPLTWLSHQLDCTLFGLEPAGPHGINVALHLANTALLFALLASMGFGTLACAWIAALFALHPSHVESVAWVSERKDLLSTLFGLAALLAYLRYARSPGFWRYVLVTLCFGASLAAKPMLVTLPVILLMLDHWPLARLNESSLTSARAAFQGSSRGKLLLEKLPWFALAAATSLATIFAQEDATSSLAGLGVAERLQTAVVGYGRYIVKLFWPAESAVLYPHPYMAGGEPYSVLQVGASLLVLAALTTLVLLSARRGWPVLGWGWFVILLVPVSGLIQVGSAAIADRYTYLSYVGLWILVVRFVGEVAQRFALARPVALLLGTLSVVGAAGLTVRDLPHWQNSEALFLRANAVAPNTPVTLLHLAKLADKRTDFEEAEALYRQALSVWPTMGLAQLGLATTINRSGRPAQAIPEFRRGLELEPSSVSGNATLGLLLTLRGKRAEGLRLAEYARELDPDSALALRNLGLVYQQNARLEEASEVLQRAYDLEPDPIAARALAAFATQAGRPAEAARIFESYLEYDPDDIEVRFSAASACVQAGNAEAARRLLDVLPAELKAFDEYRAGSLLMRLGATEQAIAAFERALEKKPGLEAARAALGAARASR